MVFSAIVAVGDALQGAACEFVHAFAKELDVGVAIFGHGFRLKQWSDKGYWACDINFLW